MALYEVRFLENIVIALTCHLRPSERLSREVISLQVARSTDITALKVFNRHLKEHKFQTCISRKEYGLSVCDQSMCFLFQGNSERKENSAMEDKVIRQAAES